MLFRSLLLAAILTPVLAVSEAFAGGSSTIRIEPRPYYGAVVTMEHGVRVWRPLPPTRHMIINPTGAPVSINLTDVRETVNHRNYVQGDGSAVPVATGGYGPGYYAGHAGRIRGHHRNGQRPAAGLSVRRMVHGARK